MPDETPAAQNEPQGEEICPGAESPAPAASPRRSPFSWFGAKAAEPAPAAGADDPLKRMAADFDNFRRRTREEIAQARAKGRREFIEELFPALDALEAAVVSGEREGTVDAYAQGVRSTRQLLFDALRRHGVERIETVGCVFDPRIHEAIQSTGECDAPVVSMEVRAGYQDGHGLLRPAQVIVGPPESGE